MPHNTRLDAHVLAVLATALSAILVLGGCATLQIDHKGAAPIAESNYMNYESVNVPTLLQEGWRYNATAGFGSVYPIIYGDHLVVANRKGEVHVVDIETGKGLGVKRFGEALNGTPVISGFQMFVPVDLGTKRGLQAWNFRTGRTSWKIRTSPVATDLVAVDDHVVMVDIKSNVSAVAMLDGSIAWEKELGSDTPIKASPVGCEGSVIIVDASGNAVGLDPETGNTKWTSAIGAPVYSRPAAHDGSLYVATTRGSIHSLSCRTGAIAWSKSIAENNVRLATPAVTPNDIMVAGTDGYVRAYSRSDGSDLWSSKIGSPIGAPPLVVSNAIFVGTLNNNIVSLDRKSGEERWRGEMAGRVKSGLAARDGELFVLSGPKYVYQYVTPIQDGTEGTK